MIVPLPSKQDLVIWLERMKDPEYKELFREYIQVLQELTRVPAPRARQTQALADSVYKLLRRMEEFERRLASLEQRERGMIPEKREPSPEPSR